MKFIASGITLILQSVRPLLGPAVCLYSPSCSEFAYQQLEKKPLVPACIAIVHRLLSCNSFTK